MGESADSNEVNGIPTTYPSAPLLLEANVGNGHINLSWVAPSSDGYTPLMQYNLYR